MLPCSTSLPLTSDSAAEINSPTSGVVIRVCPSLDNHASCSALIAAALGGIMTSWSQPSNPLICPITSNSRICTISASYASPMGWGMHHLSQTCGYEN